MLCLRRSLHVRSAALLVLAVGAAAAASPPLPPLPPGPGFAHVAVSGFLPAVVAWPPDAADSPARPLPVVVATHGSYDQPEWNCETYQKIVAGSAAVLCPRGRLRWDTPSEPAMLRFFFPSGGGWLGREVGAALSALAKAAPERIADGPAVYAGFSQGAILGVAFLVEQPARFPRAVLVEGGHGGWNASTARAYARGGGKRVLFACGRASCLASARVAASHLQAAGVATRVVYAPDQGHTYDGGVQAEVSGAFPWLVEDDLRFRSK